MKWLIVLILAAASAGSLTLLAWRSSASPPEQGPSSSAPECCVVRAMEGIGYVEPASEVRRLMFRTGGVIRSCLVQPGDQVRKGDALVELDNSTQRADLEMARKQLDQARADAAEVNAGVNPYRLKVLEHALERLRERVRHATADIKRYDELVGQGGVSKQDYDLALTRRTQAEIELREQEAELLHLRNYVTPEKRAMMAAKIEQATASLTWRRNGFRRRGSWRPVMEPC